MVNYWIPEDQKEILLSTYICHLRWPANELSGPLLSIALYKYLKKYWKNQLD